MKTLSYSELQAAIINCGSFNGDIQITGTEIYPQMSNPGVYVCRIDLRSIDTYPPLDLPTLQLQLSTILKMQVLIDTIDSSVNWEPIQILGNYDIQPYKNNQMSHKMTLLIDPNINPTEFMPSPIIVSPELKKQYEDFLKMEALYPEAKPMDPIFNTQNEIIEVSRNGLQWMQIMKDDIQYPWCRLIKLDRSIIMVREPNPPKDATAEFRAQMYRRVIKVQESVDTASKIDPS
jgi:hypothetical protein